MYRFSFSKNTDEIMEVSPSGRVRFIGAWETVKTMWALCKARRSFSLDGEIIEAPK
jgi:hypothetical protein